LNCRFSNEYAFHVHITAQATSGTWSSFWYLFGSKLGNWVVTS